MIGNKLLLVTPPDDINIDGLRILLVGISHDKTNLISTALTQLPSIPNTVLYMWAAGNDISWLMDKKNKSHLIIFDVENLPGELVGYFSAQLNSYYFGHLRDLGIINNNSILDVDQCYQLLENTITTYEKSIR
jgi:hypothetical protein